MPESEFWKSIGGKREGAGRDDVGEDRPGNTEADTPASVPARIESDDLRPAEPADRPPSFGPADPTQESADGGSQAPASAEIEAEDAQVEDYDPIADADAPESSRRLEAEMREGRSPVLVGIAVGVIALVAIVFALRSLSSGAEDTEPQERKEPPASAAPAPAKPKAAEPAPVRPQEPPPDEEEIAEGKVVGEAKIGSGEEDYDASKPDPESEPERLIKAVTDHVINEPHKLALLEDDERFAKHLGKWFGLRHTSGIADRKREIGVISIPSFGMVVLTMQNDNGYPLISRIEISQTEEGAIEGPTSLSERLKRLHRQREKIERSLNRGR